MNKFWENRKVLITGHTGFKGSWLTTIFRSTGAKVYGISKNYPTNFFKSLKLKNVKSFNEKFIKIETAFQKLKPNKISKNFWWTGCSFVT